MNRCIPENGGAKLKHGTGVEGVFWNPDKLGGLGDIEIRAVDLLSLFWGPGVRDIQQSPHLFSCSWSATGAAGLTRSWRASWAGGAWS